MRPRPGSVRSAGSTGAVSRAYCDLCAASPQGRRGTGATGACAFACGSTRMCPEPHESSGASVQPRGTHPAGYLRLQPLLASYTALPQAEPPPLDEPVVHMLFVVSAPSDLEAQRLAPINAECEVRRLFDALADVWRSGRCQARILPGQTGLSPKLQADLRRLAARSPTAMPLSTTSPGTWPADACSTSWGTASTSTGRAG